ncbi:MAG: acyl-CoA dehydrogenase [Proteobacteria bacterium]|nr:acyl-CoA dehydrogenase [Pseudomonadota bacterium]MBU4468895.1 acyl-CoA dehydrogenase [Pseudomonadota bacterium]MCG2750888.1 acyl-CoA dehydrogenase [Desulfobacteraceae bacterium]
MAQLIADRRDIDFVLFEQLKIQELSNHERFSEFNRKTIDLIVSEARKLAIREILPTQKISDEEGVRFDGGKVTVPESFHRVYQLFTEGEWLAMAEDPKWGGQGMPQTAALAAADYFNGANYGFMMYPGLTHGAGKLVESFGTEEQKNLFLKNLYTGKWTGTMLLTEPEAGSDVGALTARALKNPDGTYSITGNKIFISSGEHDLVENIIHPVLARIDGAPEGTKGISLFLVPKIRVNDDGTLGEFNDVVCTGIEEKMGLHANATCSLTLGGNGNCIGTLLGEESKGMAAMFLMMNEARLLVGHQAFCCASASYLYAVNYARQRIQGKKLGASKDSPGVPIMMHPDVRRQLITMKAYVEGMRSLLYFISYCQDMTKVTDNLDEKEKYEAMIEVLTPIAKGYVSDRAFEMCNHGLQVYGGYGFIKDYPMEQLVRDCRITMIYEGTNGIQAMDLLGRKLGLKNGKAVMDVFAKMAHTGAKARAVDNIKNIAQKFENALSRLGEVAAHMANSAMSPDFEKAFAFAYPFMEVTGDVVMAWMLLWRATIAAKSLTEKPQHQADFYAGQIKTAEYFIHNVLPVCLGKMDAILEGNNAVMEISDAGFGGS